MVDLAPLRSCLAELRDLRDGRLDIGHFVTWQESRRREDGVIVLGYPDYQPPTDRLFAAFRQAGYLGGPADYVSWMERRPDWAEPETIRTLDREELGLCLLTISRGERFGDGHWEAMLRKGAMLAAAERAIALAEAGA